ncbi:GTP cyclohydrolase I FolE [Patescibacteria group bacterium]|nr:GTP cyclohydrolase I FolE [Patescibacteria group bacterium]
MNSNKTIVKPNTKLPIKVSTKNLDLQFAVRAFLKQIGEDPNRDGIKDTPKRFEEAIKCLLSGYDRSFEKENRLFENISNYQDIITLKNIDFFSMCEHHLLPFFGYAHIGYIPGEKVLGISKLARAVDIYARRLQDQETLGFQIAETLMNYGKAKGVAILIEARHFCNIARGTEKKTSIMSTCAYYGTFKGNSQLQQSFIELIKHREKI